MIWRGPLIMKAIQQFLMYVVWGELDYLLVDLPPGTGDAQLSLCQTVPLTGGVVVTTPQEASIGVVRRGIGMLEQVKVPVLGIVENMSYVECPDCGKHIEVFGHSKVEEVAKAYDLAVLAKMPLNPELATLSDKGKIEDANVDYLDKALDLIESLKVEVTNIALPIENKEIIELAGKAKELYIYNLNKDMIIGAKKVSINSHDDFYNAIINNNVSIVITNQIEKALCDKIEANDIDVYIGEKGNPVDAINHLIDVKYEQKAHGCSGNCASCGESCSAKR